MEYIEKIKKKLCDELEEYAMKSKLTMQDLEPLQLMTDIVKNLDKIEMLEDDGGYSEARGMRGRSYMHGSSYDDEMMYSERRGRGRNAKRDRMGRYSSDDGMSYDDYSEERMDRRYSRDDAQDHLMHKMGMMMEEADPKQRKILEEAMQKIRRV
jgi:hypothetical protein